MPGSGKSALAAQIAANAKCGVLYATYEMSVEELMNRNISRETGTWIDRFHDYIISPIEAGLLYDQTKKAMPLVVHFDGTRPGSNLTELKNAAIAAKRNAGSPHLLIIIDSVHAMVRNGGLVGPDGRSVSEYTGMNLAVSRLMAIAHELKAALLLIGEQSKTNMNSPGMSAADSRALEYAPNLFISLICDLDKKPDSDGNLDVIARFSKNRRGEPRKNVALNFHGRTMTFSQGTFGVENDDDDDEDDE
jgi:replicative DNA helicase